MMTAVAMVRAVLGVTILPETAREVRAEPGLVVKAIDHPAFVRSIAIVKKRGRTLPAITDKFVELMRQGVMTQ
jgi:DNA-binding transcriptional LysR family regulator